MPVKEVYPNMPPDVVVHPDPLLRTFSTPVGRHDLAYAKSLAQRMIVVAKYSQALGISAVQIGVPKRIIAFEDRNGEWQVLVNPEIVQTDLDSHEHNIEREACLSLPGVWVEVPRLAAVTVQAWDLEGNDVFIENVGGWVGRAIQHEIDHLNAKLITDYGEARRFDDLLGEKDLD